MFFNSFGRKASALQQHRQNMHIDTQTRLTTTTAHSQRPVAVQNEIGHGPTLGQLVLLPYLVAEGLGPRSLNKALQ